MTTGYPPRSEDYTKAQGRGVEQADGQKPWMGHCTTPARSYVPSDEGAQAAMAGVEGRRGEAQEMEVLARG